MLLERSLHEVAIIFIRRAVQEAVFIRRAEYPGIRHIVNSKTAIYLGIRQTLTERPYCGHSRAKATRQKQSISLWYMHMGI